MTRNQLAMAAAATLLGAVVLLALPQDANADRVDTVRSSSAKWTYYEIEQLPDGGASIQVCGTAFLSDGGTAPGYPRCMRTPIEMPSGARRTNALNLGNDAFDNLWRPPENLQ